MKYNFQVNGSYHQQLKPCTQIDNVSDANIFVAEYTEFLASHNDLPLDRAKEIALSNIGYYAAYYDQDVFYRVIALFNTKHPVFGKTLPASPDEAMRAGMQWYKRKMQTK